MSKSPDRPPPEDATAHLGVPLLLGLAPLVFLPITGEFENHPKAVFLQCGIALLALVWIARQRGTSGWKQTPLDLPLLMFYLGCLLSLTQAVNLSAARPLLLHWTGGGILCLLLANVLSGADAVPRLFLAVALSCGAVSLVGMAQVWFGLDWVPQAMPPASTFGNRNMAAQHVAIGFPAMLFLLAVGRNARIRTVGAACLLLCALYLFHTRALAAWLAVLVVILASAIGLLRLGTGAGQARLRRWLLVTAAGALLIVCAVGLASTDRGLESDEEILQRVAAFTGTDAGTASLRWIFWKNTLAMARDHALLGVGLGNFEVQYPRYHRAAAVDWTFDEEHQLTRAHNDHLQILAELGLVGFAAWAALFASALRIGWRLLRRTSEWVQTQALFVCLGIVAFLIVACFSFPMQRAMPPVLLWALLGMLGFLHNAGLAGAGTRLRIAAWQRWVAGSVLVALLSASIVFGGKTLLSDVHYDQGLRRMAAGQPGQAAVSLEKAGELSPANTDVLLMLAGSQAGLERYEAALVTLARVLRLEPYNINAISNTGYCYLKLQRYAEAERMLETAAQILPDSPQIHTSLGTAYFEQHKNELAIDAYRAATELAKSTLFLPSERMAIRLRQPQLLLANAYVTENRLAEAIEVYEEVLENDPDLQEVGRLLAELYRETGKPAAKPESGANPEP